MTWGFEDMDIDEAIDRATRRPEPRESAPPGDPRQGEIDFDDAADERRELTGQRYPGDLR